MDYLNPTTTSIEDDEVLAGARLIDWTTKFPEAQALQVLHMIGTFKRLMSDADRNLRLDSLTADLCLIVCDILHQGRAKYSAIREQLTDPRTRDALLKFGAISYKDRIKTLKSAIISQEQLFLSKRWSKAQQDFI